MNLEERFTHRFEIQKSTSKQKIFDAITQLKKKQSWFERNFIDTVDFSEVHITDNGFEILRGSTFSNRGYTGKIIVAIEDLDGGVKLNVVVVPLEGQVKFRFIFMASILIFWSLMTLILTPWLTAVAIILVSCALFIGIEFFNTKINQATLANHAKMVIAAACR